MYGLRGATGKLDSDSIRGRPQKHGLSLECSIIMSHNELISFQSKYEVEIAAYRNSPPYKNYLKAVAVQNGLREEDIGRENMMTESIIISTQGSGRQEGTERTKPDQRLLNCDKEPDVLDGASSKMNSQQKSGSTARETCVGRNSKPL